MSIKVSQENEEAWAFNQCDCAPSQETVEASRKMCIQTSYIQTSCSPGFLFVMLSSQDHMKMVWRSYVAVGRGVANRDQTQRLSCAAEYTAVCSVIERA